MLFLLLLLVLLLTACTRVLGMLQNAIPCTPFPGPRRSSVGTCHLDLVRDPGAHLHRQRDVLSRHGINLWKRDYGITQTPPSICLADEAGAAADKPRTRMKAQSPRSGAGHEGFQYRFGGERRLFSIGESW